LLVAQDLSGTVEIGVLIHQDVAGKTPEEFDACFEAVSAPQTAV
jgi:hypothetical protein